MGEIAKQAYLERNKNQNGFTPPKEAMMQELVNLGLFNSNFGKRKFCS
ncbi:MAG: hypothetical protein LBL70_02420 [Treponema sp.]|nr:hypothetical protein [Treponema sp.]